jgi:hypothetical protein
MADKEPANTKQPGTMKHETQDWIHAGIDGHPPTKVTVFHDEIVQGDMEATPEGGLAMHAGSKPVFATGETPFNRGVGGGRGSDMGESENPLVD